MTLALVNQGICRGCAETVYLYRDRASGRMVARDGFGVGIPGPRHRCDDPALRERIPLTLDNLRSVCPDCGDTDVAVSSWGRLVECPSAHWMSDLWDEPYEEHVCVRRRVQTSKQNMQTQQTIDLDVFAVGRRA